jgi:hypothetical protein
MGRLSDRDATIIMLLLVVAIIAFPYLFYIKDTRVETEQLKAEAVTLQARLDQLKIMDEHRDEYIRLTKEINDEVDLIVASFPADIRQENYTQFLLNTEYSFGGKIDPKTRLTSWDKPRDMMLEFDSVNYGINDEIPIATETIETPYISVVNKSIVTYKCYYPVMKDLLDYFRNQTKCGIPLCYSEFSAEYDDKTGVITGAFGIDQFAIKNTEDDGRVLPDVDINPAMDGFRGNQYNGGDLLGYGIVDGVFGPIDYTVELEDDLLDEMNDAMNGIDGGTVEDTQAE